MQKIIEQLYKGEIYPSEQLNIPIEWYKEVKEIAFQAHEGYEKRDMYYRRNCNRNISKNIPCPMIILWRL